MPDNHYVLVIHGTFDAPSEGDRTWYQLDEANPTNFCRRLNDYLAPLGLGRAVWRRLNGDELKFSWTGKNQHEDRISAGEMLCGDLHRIARIDPSARIHLVAHSHGANVVLVALQRYLDDLHNRGSIVLRDVLQRVQRGTSLDSAIDETLSQLGLQQYRNWAAFKRMQADIDSGKLPPLGSWSVASLFEKDLPKYVDEWVASGETNRIGRLTFMGAPLLSKVWIPPKLWSVGSIIGSGVDVVSAVPLAMLMAYFFMETGWLGVWVWGSLVRLVFPFEGSLVPVLNPAEWARWVQVIGLLATLFYTYQGYVEFGGWRRHDLNIYFNPKDQNPHKLNVEGRVLPFDTLIVHAGLLDEVLLGFSAEPLVYGAFAPQVASLFDRPIKFKLDQLPIGQDAAPRTSAGQVLSAIWRCSIGILMWLGKPLSKLWERYLITQILKIVSGPAFGLSAREFSNAHIIPSPTIGHQKFFKESVRDVGELLIRSPPVLEEEADQAPHRYAFLWNDRIREDSKGNSWLWKNLKVEDIERRYGTLGKGREELRDRLLNTCLILEQKLKEVVGSVGILHCSYYSHPEIIERIANFLATGADEPRIGESKVATE